MHLTDTAVAVSVHRAEWCGIPELPALETVIQPNKMASRCYCYILTDTCEPGCTIKY